MEQAVLIHFPLKDGGFGSAWEREVLGGLGADLAEVVGEAGVGEFDGHDVGEKQHTLYLYGPDADELFRVVRPLLLDQRWASPVLVTKRYGPPGSAELNLAVGGRA